MRKISNVLLMLEANTYEELVELQLQNNLLNNLAYNYIDLREENGMFRVSFAADMQYYQSPQLAESQE